MKWTPIKVFVFVLLLALYGSFLIHKIALPVYDDLPRQIKIGEEIVHGHFDILYKNIFSYTEPNYTFYDHHWLAGVIFYLLNTLVGWSGLVVFKVIVLLSTFSLLFFTALKKANFWLVSSISLPVILIFAARTGLRPEIFSYLFIVIFVYILFDLEQNHKSKRIYWLIPLQLVWVNTHVFFSIGIMLVAGFLFEKVIHNYKSLLSDFKETIKTNLLIRKLFIVSISVFFISFINPRGFYGVFYHYVANFPTIISENQSLSDFQKSQVPWSNIPIVTFKFSVFFLAICFALYLWKNRRSKEFLKTLPVFYLLGSAATAILGFWMLRALALFSIMFFLASTALFSDMYIYIKNQLSIKYPKIKSIFIIIFIFILFYFLLPQTRVAVSPYNEFGVGLTHQSQDSAKFFIDNNLHGPIFNDADVGSYLIYNLYPKERVFSDNRFGDAYSIPFFKDINYGMVSDENTWLEYSKRYDFNVIFFYQYDGGPHIRDFLWRRLRDPAWVLVYNDIYTMIFVRNIPENKPVIDKFAITKDNVGERLKYLANSDNFDDEVSAADTFNLIGREDLGSQTFLNIAYRWPEKGKIWMTMGEWEVSHEDNKSHVLAMMYLEKAVAEGERSAEAYSFLGLAYDKLGQTNKAIKALKKSVEIDPDRRDAKSLLVQLEK